MAFTNTCYQQRVEYASLISVVPPLDLAECAALARQRLPQSEITLLDANALGLSEEEQVARLSAAGAETVVYTAATYAVNSVSRLAAALRRHVKHQALIGTHGSALPEETLRETPALDAVVRGEPEETVAELLAAWATGRSLETVRGIHYRRDGAIVGNEDRPPLADLDALPFPARDLLPNELYSSPFGRRVTALRATRGCPGQCRFCDSHLLFGRRTRLRSPEKVVAEMAECHQRYGVDYVAIIDHTFTTNRSFVAEICRRLIARGLPRRVRWVCNTRVDMLDDETAALMKKAGCLQVGLGVESAANARLAAMGKGVTEEQIRQAIIRLRRHGIIAMGYAIIGFPQDDAASITETRAKIFRMNPHTLQLSFATPLPGSRLRADCLAEDRLLSDNWDDYLFLNKPIIRNDTLTPAELTAWRDNMLRRFYFRPAKLLELAFFFAFRARVNIPAAWRAARKIIGNLRRARGGK